MDPYKGLPPGTYEQKAIAEMQYSATLLGLPAVGVAVARAAVWALLAIAAAVVNLDHKENR